MADPFVYRPAALQPLLPRLLRWSLWLGALYDGVFALAMLVAPGLPARLLHLPLPGEPFYLWLIAILLLMLGALYVVAATDPRRYDAIVAVAIAGRLAGAVAFAAAALAKPALGGLWVCCAGDAAFGLAHGVLRHQSR